MLQNITAYLRRGVVQIDLVLLTAIVVVGGLLTFVVSQFIEGAPALVDQAMEAIRVEVECRGITLVWRDQ